MLALPIYYFFLKKIYQFNSTLSVLSNAHKILRENQDCVFSYAVSICAWRRKTEGRKDRNGAMHICICSFYLEQLVCTLKDGYPLKPLQARLIKPATIFMEASLLNHCTSPVLIAGSWTSPSSTGSPY
jgi:hypothetical protein